MSKVKKLQELNNNDQSLSSDLIEEIQSDLFNMMSPNENNENLTAFCPVTNKELYRYVDGYLEILAPYGRCKVSGQDFHIDALVVTGEVPTLPGRYDGHVSTINFEQISQ